MLMNTCRAAVAHTILEEDEEEGGGDKGEEEMDNAPGAD